MTQRARKAGEGKEARAASDAAFLRRLSELCGQSHELVKEYFLSEMSREEAFDRYARILRAVAAVRRNRFQSFRMGGAGEGATED